MLPDPGVHGDAGGHPDVDRPGGPELGDGHHQAGAVPRRVGEAGRLRPEQQQGVPGQGGGLDGAGARQVVDRDHGQLLGPGEGDDVGHGIVVPQMLVAVGDHRPAPVPAPSADDVHLGGGEGVGRADHGADVVVVAEVLYGHVEGVPSAIEVGDDGVPSPVAVPVDDVPTVTVLEQRDTLGGRSGRWSAEGFTFDTGPSWYLMPEVIDRWFRLMGSSAAAELDLRTLSPGDRRAHV